MDSFGRDWGAVITEVVHTSPGRGADAASLLKQFRIADADLKLVRAFGEIFKPEIEAKIGEFYDWLTVQLYFSSFFADKRLKTANSKGNLE